MIDCSEFSSRHIAQLPRRRLVQQSEPWKSQLRLRCSGKHYRQPVQINVPTPLKQHKPVKTKGIQSCKTSPPIKASVFIICFVSENIYRRSRPTPKSRKRGCTGSPWPPSCNLKKVFPCLTDLSIIPPASQKVSSLHRVSLL